MNSTYGRFISSSTVKPRLRVHDAFSRVKKPSRSASQQRSFDWSNHRSPLSVSVTSATDSEVRSPCFGCNDGSHHSKFRVHEISTYPTWVKRCPERSPLRRQFHESSTSAG